MAQSGIFHLPVAGGSNYVSFPNGLLIQWGIYGDGGSVTIPAGETHMDAVIPFPIPFAASTGTPLVVASVIGLGVGTDSQQNVCIASPIQLGAQTNLSQFTLRLWKQASVGTANNPAPVTAWVAIGRWA